VKTTGEAQSRALLRALTDRELVDPDLVLRRIGPSDRVTLHDINPQRLMETVEEMSLGILIDSIMPDFPVFISPTRSRAELLDAADLEEHCKISKPAGYSTDRPIIAVVDSGPNRCIPGLEELLWWNDRELIGTDGEDDDSPRNGYVDDFNGGNILNHSGSFSRKSSPHATDIAKMMVAELALYEAGKKPHLMFCQYFDGASGCVSGLVECLWYVVDRKEKGDRIAVVNISAYSQQRYAPLEEALQKLNSLGVLVVAAAGEGFGSLDVQKLYPNRFGLKNVVTVGSSSSAGKNHSSNFGRRTVETFADATYSSYSAARASAWAALQAPYDWRMSRNLLISAGYSHPGLEAASISGRRIAGPRTMRTAGACRGATTRRLVSPVPSGGQVVSYVHGSVQLEAVSIECSSPGPAPKLSVYDQNGKISRHPPSMRDRGPTCIGCWDRNAGDGVFSAQWTPPRLGSYVLRVEWPSGECEKAMVAVCPKN